MENRTITLPEIFTKKAKLEKSATEKIPFSFSWSGISDEEMALGVEALCHKLLCDKLRSKAKQKGSTIDLRAMSAPCGLDGISEIKINISELFARTRAGRLSFEDEEPEAIVEKLKGLGPEKVAKILEMLSK